jgi:hypothetical protein
VMRLPVALSVSATHSRRKSGLLQGLESDDPFTDC